MSGIDDEKALINHLLNTGQSQRAMAIIARKAQAQPMTITEFLLARIAEDEAVAAEQDGAEYFTDGAWPEGMPARVLAECAAKRAIVAMAPSDDGYVKCGDWESCSDSCPAIIAEHAIKALAAVYADNPDYRQEWAC